MKKVLSVVLAIAMIASLCTVCFTANAETDTDLMGMFPEAGKWVTKSGGEGNITVTQEGASWVFKNDKGWPEASCDWTSSMTNTMFLEDQINTLYLNFAFDVTKQANLYLYFNGQNPMEQDATLKNSISLNVLIDPTKIDDKGNIIDLDAGHYEGSVPLADLAKVIDVEAEDGSKCMRFSGFKAFAVGDSATVTLTKLEVGSQAASTTPPPTTTQGGATTTKGGATTTAAAPTTTAANAKTGIEDNVVLYAIIALGAAAVITVSVISSKKAKNNK